MHFNQVLSTLLFLYRNGDSNLKKKRWFQFTNHKWKELDDGIELRRRISNQVVNEYLKICSSITLVSATPRPSDLGGLGLAPFGAMVGFWGPMHLELAQNAI